MLDLPGYRSNVAWLKESFTDAAAGNAVAVVLAIHADMFESGLRLNREGFRRHSGFARFGSAFVEEANRCGKPVLFGDYCSGTATSIGCFARSRPRRRP